MRAVLALGGNLETEWGGPVRTIQAALSELSLLLPGSISVSAGYVTPAFPAGSGPDFVNAALSVTFGAGPTELLAICHQVEQTFLRERKARWQARSVDIDLLAYGDMVLPDHETVKDWIGLTLEEQLRQTPDELILPHPRLHERGFVLVPMADVAADWVHPVLGKSVSDLLKSLPEAEIAQIQRIPEPLWPE